MHELANRIKQGDREAFDTLCKRVTPSLLALASIYLPAEWAEDAVQDALLALWQRHESIDPSSSLMAYLQRIVHNRCLSMLRKKNFSENRRDWTDNEIRMLVHSVADPDENAAIRRLFSEDIREEMEKNMRKLPPKTAEVFRLSYVEGMGNREIAEMLGVSVRTVETHKYQALKFLRKALLPDELK